jgi:hypothetical protein
MYRLDSRLLKPIHGWVKELERAWNERFDAMDDLLAELKGEEN